MRDFCHTSAGLPPCKKSACPLQADALHLTRYVVLNFLQPSTFNLQLSTFNPHANPFNIAPQYIRGRISRLSWYIDHRSFDWSKGKVSTGVLV